jgi:hypothetical protein
MMAPSNLVSVWFALKSLAAEAAWRFASVRVAPRRLAFGEPRLPQIGEGEVGAVELSDDQPGAAHEGRADAAAVRTDALPLPTHEK